MTENIVNIYSIAYRDCKEVSDSIGTNEEVGKANTILFYMDEILEALSIAGELQEIGTIEEFKALKEKNKPKKPLSPLCGDCQRSCVGCDRYVDRCRNCNGVLYVESGKPDEYCPHCGQKLDWDD